VHSCCGHGQGRTLRRDGLCGEPLVPANSLCKVPVGGRMGEALQLNGLFAYLMENDLPDARPDSDRTRNARQVSGPNSFRPLSLRD